MRALVIFLALAAAAPCAAQQTPADSVRVYELHEVEVLPRPQNVDDFRAALRQAYPPHLRQAGVGGTVELSFVVGPDGVPADVRVVSTPDTAFDAPSVQALSLLRFAPAQVQGRPVAVRVVQPIGWVAEVAPDFTGQGAAPGTRARGDSVNGYELSEVEQLPRLLNQEEYGRELARSYPVALRDAGVSGTVEVRFRVDEDGRTSNQTVTRSTDPRFDEPTLRTLRMMRFRPARIGGRPVRVWVTQPIQWTVSTQSIALEPPGAQGGRPLDPGSVVCDDPRCVAGAVDVPPQPRDPGALARAMAREYPATLRSGATAGQVVVRFRVETDGTVSTVQVIGASHPAFQEPSVRAVRTLRYTPARVNGQPVAVWMQQPLNWPGPPPNP